MHNRDILTSEPVEQSGLADIRPANDGDSFAHDEQPSLGSVMRNASISENSTHLE
jgi:hypothetical protein